MSHDDQEAEGLEGGEWLGDEHDPRARTEKLVSQLAELYNENTLLRERVRALEREMRRISRRG